MILLSEDSKNMRDIQNSIHLWLSENCTKDRSVFGRIRSLAQHFFYCAESLYPMIEEDPLPTPIKRGILIDSSGTNGVYFVNPPDPATFFKIRGILSLAGDMVLLQRAIRGISDRLDKQSLSDLIDRHKPSLVSLHAARHFFTHFDERIGKKIDKHGVSGELEIKELRIVFRKESKACFYLGFKDNMVFFHDKQRYETSPTPKAVSYTKSGLSPLFSLVMDLYTLFTSHRIHSKTYPESRAIYPLFS